jgi:hypothetical protein
VEGEKLHPANYRGCRHEEEMQKKKLQRTRRINTGRVFSSNLNTPGMSFAAALRGKTEEQQRHRKHQMAGPDAMEPKVPVALPQNEQQKTDQSFRAPNVNSWSMDKMLKVVVTVV